MDTFLIDYLKSGKAWALIGSGPSIEMGYPSWDKLAEIAAKEVRAANLEYAFKGIESSLKQTNYPLVFEKARDALGGPRLLQVLFQALQASRLGIIYKMIARWPIRVYLTTNYDNEISKHLSAVGETYLEYSNSEDHFGFLIPDFQGAIVKLHGDLRSENGLILTSSQYQDILENKNWNYWRTKMISLFQMVPIVVIGHSLSDPNIKHILQAAKEGAGVTQPICWIAPDVEQKDIRYHLEKYRIRVIPYSNKDGTHRNLCKLIEHINQFMPPRITIRLSKEIRDVSRSPLGPNAASPGFFVYNKLSTLKSVEKKRPSIVLSAIEAALPKLKNLGTFTLEKALKIGGWPEDVLLDEKFKPLLVMEAIETGLLEAIDEKNFRIGKNAEILSSEKRKAFKHLQHRFKQSLKLRIKKNYPELTDSDSEKLSTDIERSLIGYFKNGGLTLASTMFSDKHEKTNIPNSIIHFISEASAIYNDTLKRQAFCTISVDIFTKTESVERDYLGRISQGFFGFHAFGIFGDVAIERLNEAKDTVWLVDSNVQISALALGSPTNAVFRGTLLKLKEYGVRLFTNKLLFNETYQHLIFAINVIEHHGAESSEVLAAAAGDLPYRKSNAFLQGFLHWQAAGNPCDWAAYMYAIYSCHNPSEEDLSSSLESLGIEVINFSDWPGFSDIDYIERSEYKDRIVQKILDWRQSDECEYSESHFDSYKKAEPEAEALVIVKNERKGKYHVLSKAGDKSLSWFISDTSILNIIEPGLILTWQPEAFIRFVSTLGISPINASDAFQAILLNVAQSAVVLLDDKVVSTVFGGMIDQTRLNMIEQRNQYRESLEHKYGEPPESVFDRISPRFKLLGAIQLAEERAQIEKQKRKQAEGWSDEAKKRASSAEKKLREVEHYRKRMEAKKLEAKRKARKQKSKAQRKKKNK